MKYDTLRQLLLTDDDPERKIQRAQKFLFKNDAKTLTPEATEACHQIGVVPETLVSLSVEHFFGDGDTINLANVRHQHYQKKRKCKSQVICRKHHEGLLESLRKPAEPAISAKLDHDPAAVSDRKRAAQTAQHIQDQLRLPLPVTAPLAR